MNEEEREFQVETTLDLATAQRRVSLQASIWQILLSPQYRASPLWGLMVEGTEARKGCVGRKYRSQLRSSHFLEVYPWSCLVLDTEDSVHDRALLHGKKITDKDSGSAQCCQGEELNLCGLELLGIWESPTTLVVSAPAPHPYPNPVLHAPLISSPSGPHVTGLGLQVPSPKCQARAVDNDKKKLGKRALDYDSISGPRD